jgi:hypothetical protein
MRIRQLVRDIIRKTPNPERRYINDRGTLITIAVKAHHDGLRDERVKRAEAEIEPTEHLAQYAIRHHISDGIPYSSGSVAWCREKSRRAKSAEAYKAQLSAAQSELKTAKRIVAERNGLGEVCVVHVSPVKMSRAWPNALPGGTSRRRAERISLRAQAKASGYVWYERDILPAK